MPEQRSGRALYDAIGSGYCTTRRADPVIVGALYDHLGIRPDGRYLDVGCGSGNHTVALAARGGEWTGINPSATMVAEANRAHAGIAWHLAEAWDAWIGLGVAGVPASGVRAELPSVCGAARRA